VGRGANCKRVVAETRSARVAAHDPEVFAKVAGRTNRQPLPRSTLVNLLKNHADAIIACDFCVVASATFRILYVFVVMEHASRRIVHLNVTAHPTAAWTLQQLREAIPSDHTYRFTLHDRDAIFSTGIDASVAGMGLEVIKTPVRSPKANSLCERLIGTLRRECLDWIIPLTEEHLRKALRSWLSHYNRGRPHYSLGPHIQRRGRKIDEAAPLAYPARRVATVSRSLPINSIRSRVTSRSRS
jgi:putative transposase